ncbi:TadE family protein [Microbacterium protaetiae]|uniref:TadE family protein n=1 Tax=Microbacterium protaetiae TaxID=2509458 RepID=A0A4P6EFB8_9MICO|nr:TadE family protein [Microbacterium protaetiae]QAY61070.1 TadE family protein [Microbacterium protaetiae]
MRRWRIFSDDEGTAPLEFILAGMLLLVPIVYLIVSLGLIQEQSLGVESGARHLARAIATAPDAASARDRADAVADSIVDEYGIDRDELDVAISCRPAGECPRAGATLVVTVTTRAALPLVPPVLQLDRLASVPLSASSAAKVSRLWGQG